MDISSLAQVTAVYLAPFLPYLIKAGEKASEEAGKKFGEGAWEKAKTIWGNLRPKVEAKPAALDAVQDVAVSPSDEDAVDSFRRQLKKLLKDDNQLADEVARLISQSGVNIQVTASGQGSVAIGRDAVGNTIITGQKYSAGNEDATGDGLIIKNSSEDRR